MTTTRDLDLRAERTTDGLRLVAECDDELTEYMFMGSVDRFLPWVQQLDGPLGQMLSEDHVTRCETCSAWFENEKGIK